MRILISGASLSKGSSAITKNDEESYSFSLSLIEQVGVEA